MDYSNDDVLKIAKLQTRICWLFFLMILIVVGQIVVHPLIAIIQLALGVINIFSVYQIAGLLKEKRPWMYVIGCFLPLVSLFVMLYVIQKATKILKTKGIKVGVMGAHKSSLSILSASE